MGGTARAAAGRDEGHDPRGRRDGPGDRRPAAEGGAGAAGGAGGGGAWAEGGALYTYLLKDLLIFIIV